VSSGERSDSVRRERGIVIGNVEDKYASRNPIALRLVDGFLRSFRDLVVRSGARSAFEAGCGEGRLTLELARLGLAVRATDFSTEIIEEARRRARESERPELAAAFAVADVHDLGELDGAELVVCCEVFEHLREPDRALDGLARLATPWLLASVPREPLWRALNVARGRYVARLGDTPGHLQHWSKRGFLRFLSRRFEIVEVRSPLPWTMALARRREARL
jgi:2-polyprenyl-3-methyl-5-hydroxy-6-metoxy-1,4-benzoquinol methylase